ncbi:MAG: Mur ligase domain-containing protein [bacterium]|nr:Mur ligase domain-containing protein [bacterium]MDA1024588.1 Mur ligase domain-containing protein [bacterium]
MFEAQNVHIIGIGGIGTSAVARWFLEQNKAVSGSDAKASDLTHALSKEGAQVKLGHFADNIPSVCDFIVYSSAVPKTNVERQAADERGIPSLSYPEFLGQLAKTKRTIAVSGTNGKSTTTAMIAKIFLDAGFDPTVIIGTKSPDLPHENLRIGKSDWFIVEACEHMAHMLNIAPEIAVVTNVEEDHLDFYRDIDHIRDSFQEWIDGAKYIVLNAKDTESQKLKTTGASYFGLGADIQLSVPGAFNQANAAAAIEVAKLAGIDEANARASLKAFQGTWRRFEMVGARNGTDIYSDYAHHPTAVQGAIQGFKTSFPDRRLIICFEPHQFSRTEELFDEFAASFGNADVLILSEIYEVEGRNESHGITSKDLIEAIKKQSPNLDTHYAANLHEAETLVRRIIENGDIFVAMGAGDIDQIARNLVDGK